jgi:hypothetical protein
MNAEIEIRELKQLLAELILSQKADGRQVQRDGSGTLRKVQRDGPRPFGKVQGDRPAHQSSIRVIRVAVGQADGVIGRGRFGQHPQKAGRSASVTSSFILLRRLSASPIFDTTFCQRILSLSPSCRQSATSIIAVH